MPRNKRESKIHFQGYHAAKKLTGTVAGIPVDRRKCQFCDRQAEYFHKELKWAMCWAHAGTLIIMLADASRKAKEEFEKAFTK